MVPEVVLSAEVQTALDAIVQSRLETEKAAQDELKARAEAAAEQARAAQMQQEAEAERQRAEEMQVCAVGTRACGRPTGSH